MKHRRATVAFVAAAAVGLLGACAGQDPSPGASDGTSQPPAAVPADMVGVEVLTGALAAAREAGSARISGSVGTTTPQGGSTATISGVLTFDPAAMDLTMSSDLFAQGAQVRQVLLDGKVYVQVPELGDKWMHVDPSRFAGLVNPQLDPERLRAMTGLQAAGPGSVDGVAVEFYRGDIGLDEALALAGLPAETLDLVRQHLGADAGSATARFAIDEQGRLVEWTLDATIVLSDGGTMTSTADVRWSDFGVATDIRAPQPGLIADPEALSGLVPQG